MSNYELPLTISVSLQRGSEILGALNQPPAKTFDGTGSSICHAIPISKLSPTTASYSKAVPSRTIWRRPLMVANLRAKRFRAPRRCGYIPNPYGRDLGLGYRVRTLPQGRDRWGKYSTAGRLHPFSRRVSVPCEGNRKGRKAYWGLVRMWISPCRRDGEVSESNN